MNKVKPIRSQVLSRTQRGISLLVVLVLLLVMSVLGIAVLRSSAMQERMTANMLDRNEAMQAAEAGLLRAQNDVVRGTFNAMWDGSKTFAALRTAASATCATGFCDRSLTGDTEASFVPGPNALTWRRVDNGATTSPETHDYARYSYLVEYLGKAKGESSEVAGVCNTTSAPRYLCERPLFRITAYGRGRGLAQVMLQANVISQPK